MTRTAVLRIALVAVALVAGAWIGLSLRSTQLESEGRALLAKAQRGPITPSELRRGRSVLDRAGRFSVDQGPRIVEGALLNSAHRPQEAAAVAERVIANEPNNLFAWIVLYLALSDSKGAARDASRADEALHMVRSLNPLAGRALRPSR